MADRSIGKIFVELDLDSDRYTKGQKRLLKDATSTALSIEKNFRNLGIKSSAEMDLMRAKINNSYEAIKHNAKATTNDIYRAEKAMKEKLKKLDEQQFGVRENFLNKMKEHWVATAAVIYIAWKKVSSLITRITSVVKEVTWQAAKFETFGIVMRVVGNNAGYTGEQMEEFSKTLQTNGIAMMESRRVLMMMAEAHIDLNKSQQLGRIAQNAAVIGMINSSQAMEQMIWGIQSANLRVLRTIGINVSFERSYQKLVDTMNAMDPTANRTVENLTELEKVTARTNEVISFGPRIFGTYTSAMETAAKQALSLQRYWDNLKILAGTIFTPVFAQIISDITGSIVDLNKDLRENKEEMNEYGNQLRLKFIDMEISILKIVDAMDTMWSVFDPVNLIPFGSTLRTYADLMSEIWGNVLVQQEKVSENQEKLLKPESEEDDATADAKAKKLKDMSNWEIAAMKEKVNQSKDISEIEEKINTLYETREKILFSMSEEGKRQSEERAEAAERERLAVYNELKLKREKEKLDRKIEEVNVAAQQEIIKLRTEGNEKLRDDIEKNSIKVDQVGKDLFQAEKTRIDKLTAMYEAMGLNQVLIEQWAKNEMILAAEEYRQYEEKRLEKAEKEAEKAAKNMVDLSKRTAEAMESNMSDIFFDAIIGELDDLKTYAISFLKAIARALADFYAQKLTTSIIGGVVSAATLSGAYEEYPVSDQEYYSPYTSTSSMSMGMTSTSAETGNNYNVSIYANDSKSFSQMVEDNPQSVITVVQKSMKNNTSLRNTMRRTA